jgi:adenine-specific DNA-methyltransferase
MANQKTDINPTDSLSLVDERRAQLAAIIPEAFSEGKLDISALKRSLCGGSA